MTTPTIDRTACPGRRHGTYAAYKVHGCRCPDARALRIRVDKRRRAGLLPPARVPSVGTTRRLQALTALGWPADQLAARIGVDHSGLCRLRAGYSPPTVTRRLHHRIAAVFEQLSATPGPSRRARSMAAARGWVPPLAWADDLDDPDAQPVGVRRPTTVRVLAPCGTVAAWKRHRYRHEPPCDACREAKRVNSAAQRAAS